MAKKTADVSIKKPFFKHDPYVSIASLLFLFFASQFIAAILISLYPAIQDWTEAQSREWLQESVAAQFSYILIAETIAISLILKVIKYASVARRRIGLVKPIPADVGWALVTYGLYFLSFLTIGVLAKLLIPGLDFDQEQSNGFENAYSQAGLLMTFLALVVIVPIAEELMFRGFLFTSLRAKYDFWISAIITSAIFGIAHLQFGANTPLLWVAAIDTFILSIFLCKLRENRQSIWSPVFLHGIKNLVAFLVLFGARF